MEQTKETKTAEFKIKEMLQLGMKLSVMSVFNALSTYELKHYICALKKEGLPILSKWVYNENTKKRFKVYWLEEKV